MTTRKSKLAAAPVPTGKRTDFSQNVYVGETILPSFGKDTSIEIITADAKKLTYQFPYEDIDTSSWAEGMYTVLIHDKNMDVKMFEVINPLNIASTYTQLMNVIKEIDAVVEARLSAGGVLSTTINNKTLLNESLQSLYNLRSQYVRRANAEVAKIQRKDPGNPIKSISTFKRGF
ncbi:hypothetical protein [Cedecea lapagei]|uniref:hypothetical protein n=1 Tax=Cedecea lapagei TaxID=158823 RepID=UPI001BCF5F25|nr:hypothetical protein [Cedecea lapagei]